MMDSLRESCCCRFGGKRNDERRQQGRKSERLMTKKERKKQQKRGTRGARGSDKTLVVQIRAVTMWESNPADALFGAACYYPVVPQGSRPMLTQQNHFVPTDIFPFCFWCYICVACKHESGEIRRFQRFQRA